MQDFKIISRIYHPCISQDAFSHIKEFFDIINQPKEQPYKMNDSFFIDYDEEFKFITYQFDRKYYKSLEELFNQQDQKEFQKTIQCCKKIIEELKNDQNKFQDLSIQNFDSQKILVELDKKDNINNLFILNIISQQNISNQLSVFQQINDHLEDLNNVKSNFISKTNKNVEKQKMDFAIKNFKRSNFTLDLLFYDYINQIMNSKQLDELGEYTQFENYLKQKGIQYQKQIEKKIEQLDKLQNKEHFSHLIIKLKEIICINIGLESKLQLIIVKIMQKHNLLKGFFSKTYLTAIDSELDYQFKQYLREIIYNSFKQENPQKVNSNIIVNYLSILSFKKSSADFQENIKLIIRYTHEKLAIFKYEWSGKILSDKEILQQFCHEQTKIIKSEKKKLINSDYFVDIVQQSQIYKARVQFLELGLDTLKQYLKIDLSLLAKDYFHLYQQQLRSDQFETIKEDEIMSKIFLEITKSLIKQIN